MNKYKLLLILLVIVHFAMVLVNIVSLFILPMYAPWYIAMPVDTYLINLTFTRMPCAATNLENRLRRLLGMKEIGGFIGHYVVRPIKELLKCYWH